MARLTLLVSEKKEAVGMFMLNAKGEGVLRHLEGLGLAGYGAKHTPAVWCPLLEISTILGSSKLEFGMEGYPRIEHHNSPLIFEVLAHLSFQMYCHLSAYNDWNGATFFLRRVALPDISDIIVEL